MYVHYKEGGTLAEQFGSAMRAINAILTDLEARIDGLERSLSAAESEVERLERKVWDLEDAAGV